MRKEAIFSVFLVATNFLVSVPVYADESCDSQVIESVGEQFDIKNFNLSAENGVIVAETCKTWPYKDNIVLSVFAYAAAPKEKKDIGSEKKLLIVMVDKHSRRVISSYQRGILEDALTEVGPDSFQLDTARYQLSEEVRAFGLRFHSAESGPSCAEHEFDNELTLFVPKGNELRPVFRQFMNFQRALTGCIGTTTGHDAWEYASLSIAIKKTASNGYADLQVSAVIEPDTDIKPPPPAMDMKKRVETLQVHFDGNAYSPVGDPPWWWTTAQ